MQTKSIRYRRFSNQQKAAAVKLILEDGVSKNAVAKQLQTEWATVHYWVKKAQASGDPLRHFSGKAASSSLRIPPSGTYPLRRGPRSLAEAPKGVTEADRSRAVSLVMDQGASVKDASRSTGVPESTLYILLRLAKAAGEKSEGGSAQSAKPAQAPAATQGAEDQLAQAKVTITSALPCDSDCSGVSRELEALRRENGELKKKLELCHLAVAHFAVEAFAVSAHPAK